MTSPPDPQERFRRLGVGDVSYLQDVPVLQELLENAPDYAERVTGFPPGPSDALGILMGGSEDVAEHDKFGFGLWVGADLVAFADVLRAYPDRSSAFIGLLLVRADRRGRGVGRRLHERVLGEIRGWDAALRVEVGIAAENASVAEPFWRAMGYAPTGRVRPWRYGGLVVSTSRWELDL